jgi:hypothetical protein
MKNLLSFHEFLNEAKSEMDPQKQSLFDEIGKITDVSLKQIMDLCKKNKLKTVSRGTAVGGINIVDSNKNILFDVVFWPNKFEKKTQIIHGVSVNPTTDRTISSGLPFKTAQDLRSKYPAYSALVDNFAFLQNSPKSIETLSPQAVKEYQEFVDELMDGIERNFEYLQSGKFI